MTQAIALPKRLRIAALQCDFEGGETQTLKIPALWREFGFNCEQLFHTHAELYTAVYEHEKHKTLVNKYLVEAATNDIRIILYMNCHILNPSQADKAAEWAIMDKAGKPLPCYETYLMNCMNSPWMDYFTGLLEGLRPLSICGIFFDGPVLKPCFCGHCRRKFESQYGESLLDAPEGRKDAFAMQTYLEGKRILYRKVKEVNPGWVAYFNEVTHRRSLEEMQTGLAHNDIVAAEGGFFFYRPPREVPIWRCGLQARLLEAVAQDKPTVIFWAGDHKSWTWYPHTLAESKLAYATSMANGANLWYGIHCSTDVLKSATGEAVKEVFHFDREHEDLLRNTESIAPVALFHSFDSTKHYPTGREEADFHGREKRRDPKAAGNYDTSQQGAVAALVHANEPFDVVTEIALDRLSRYGVVLLPTAACMREETGRRLAEYVAQGGVLIADSETSLFDENYNKRDNFLLADLFGIDFRGYRQYDRFDFGEMGTEFCEQFHDGIVRIPAPFTAIDVNVREGTEVLARLCPKQPGPISDKPAPARYPFVMRRRFGKGTAYYLAACYFGFYGTHGIVHYRRMIESIIERRLPQRFRVVGAPPSLEVTVRRCRDTGKVLVNLVNFSGGMTRPIERCIPLHGMRLRVPQAPSRATALVAGQSLAITGNEIALCPVHHFETVLLDG